MITLYGDLGILALFVVILLLGLVFQGRVWVSASLVLSSIPGIWYAASSYIAYVLGFIGNISLHGLFLIYLRTTLYSLLVLFTVSITSPIELSMLLKFIGLEKYVLAPHLLWRLMPLGLRFMRESLEIGSLKKESVKHRLAPAIAALIEAGYRVEESCYYRLQTPLTYPISMKTDKYSTMTLLVSPIITLLVLYIIHTFHVL